MNKKKTQSKTAKSGSTKKKSPSVKELNEQINNEKDKYVRLFAEFENYKRRTAKERIDLFKTAGKEVLSSLIPVVEDFKRALNQEDPNQEDSQGIQLIYNKLQETLKNQGLEELEVKVGDSFDSEIHEAISQIPAQNDDQKGKIIDIIEGGYKLGDQVIKFPKVVVAQ
jgi:molecular chaperone GrpE